MKPADSNSISQACAVPYRVHSGRIEVCIVTSMKKRRWTFPKGIIEADETPIEAASTPGRFCPAEAAALPDTRSLEDTGQPAMNGPFEMVEKQPESLDGLG